MKISFLCANHRAWILEDLRRADTFWHDWIDDAEQGQHYKDGEQVILKLGAAWDIAYALLDSSWPNVATAAKRFGYSAALLYRALGAARSDLRADVMKRTEAQLLRLIEAGEARREVFRTLAALDMTMYDEAQVMISPQEQAKAFQIVH